ncbi:uncharacterized protein LOC143193464 [Rhynchophorus ferrugineus]|uniref:uncharacterized protein LOC143193464 n=1 Tax=Rhynchophorus ferrugineus TaxID=354439 RepID=UPI003FCC5892
MNSVQYSSKLKELKYVKLPIPTITEGNQVLIKVAYSGICGTDLHIIEGEFPCSENAVTLGHEFSGIVVDCGKDVKNVRKGDRVAIDPNEGCRCCDHCHSGTPHYCDIGGINSTIGIHRHGGWSTYALVPMHSIQKLPGSVSLEQGALTEPLSCLSHGWDLLSPVPVGSKILVIGAGIIGNLWVSLLHLQGHRNVTVSEPNLDRLNYTRNLDTGYDLLTPSQLKINKQNNPNYHFDVVIDCSGFCPAIEEGLNLLGKGGKLCCFGVAPPHGTINVSPYQLYLKEISIIAVNVNPYSTIKSVGFIEALGDRYLNYKKLGVEVFSLNDYQKAIQLLKAGKIAKAVFKL